MPLDTGPDPSSLSNFQDAAVTHSHIELDVDFETRVLSGFVEHTAVVRTDGVAELALDTSQLTIEEITVNGSAARYRVSDPHPVLGSRLAVRLPAGVRAGEVVAVAVRYSAPPGATAVQWLPPEQTAGKRHPYLFTQCQAIHARSILPCQDAPAAKFTYTAAVRVPRQLRALMSAVPVEGEGRDDGDGGTADLRHVAPRPGTKVYRFRQGVPISSYLLALAVGNLESRQLGPISAVWSEPEMVEAGASEFAETPQFLEAAVELAGPYLWGRYDLLLLPPSFPYGGMENPCLTFVTPALLAGDRSMTKTVAHEIAHSWTGNLVTNSDWQHLWLNEGLTRFLERKILGRLYGEEMYQLQASIGALILKETVQKEFGEGHPLTALVPDLSGGVDPDAALSQIPYEKGFYFAASGPGVSHYLQELVGGAAAFQPFFRAYLQRFQSQPLGSEDFRAFFCDHFQANEVIAQIDWQAWLYSPGMPPVTNRYDESLAAGAYALATRWHTADVLGIGGGGPTAASPADIEGWSSTQLIAFTDKLGELRAMQPLHPSITRRLDELYGLDVRRNSELRTSWYQLCINAGDDAILPHVEAFLQEQGRARYLRKLYRALRRSRSSRARQAALDIFQHQRAAYHPIAVRLVAADLGLATADT
ncbi:hypothetical protein CHLNCDRAFT_144199 [Chlorella variabilis]|uniref:Peptidase M1 leukotriene A4 hydrolase/aminopeptidase C-terminal domain-containing protein n=1 Tax=Chlorella variabilis TaxID=554065 RepID=E1ZC52_CHLVA|nr:hypothetical protein CHLNCDRAFT_144199 [Chlorella variabilis]EFN56549.1 hypothetical protein CHLNCDRAFT_144199 [Chlorella variabilis]|eukprot:XP_005848651.1 hypothetical protein CHLNCDRAFT_144199 [Chlorella variabilis]